MDMKDSLVMWHKLFILTFIPPSHLVVLKHPMLHNNFQSHLPFGSGEGDF